VEALRRRLRHSSAARRLFDAGTLRRSEGARPFANTIFLVVAVDPAPDLLTLSFIWCTHFYICFHFISNYV
jgi:hypothetical protein